MQSNIAQIEVPSSADTTTWLNVRYKKITESHMDNLFLAGLFRETCASSME